jgi:hypothetical protein
VVWRVNLKVARKLVVERKPTPGRELGMQDQERLAAPAAQQVHVEVANLYRLAAAGHRAY